MKKFISMIMAAAMVVTMVPATAFAASADATFKLLGAEEITVAEAEAFKTTGVDDDFELQIKLLSDASVTKAEEEFKITIELENAKSIWDGTTPYDLGAVVNGGDNEVIGDVSLDTDPINADGDKIKLVVKEEAGKNFQKDDIVYISLPANTLALTKTKVGTVATVKVTGDFGTSEELVALTVVEKGIKAELDDECVDVAVEEIVTMENIVIKPAAGDDFGDVLKTTEEVELTLKLNKGFEFANDTSNNKFNIVGATGYDYDSNAGWTVIDGDKIVWTFDPNELTSLTKLTISGLDIEATTADAGDVATVTVKMGKLSSVKVADVVKVIDYKVIMELDDADEDVPVIYSGVNAENDGITDDSDHKSLAVSIYETFPGAWDMDKAFTLSLPEGVYVTAAELVGDNTMRTRATGNPAAANADLEAAYVKGDHVDFEFAKRTFVETDPKDADRDDANEMTFVLTLVADPGFVGDVTLKLEGAAVDTQEVVIAKFVSPMTIKAEQNDVIIDYRYTEVPTDIVITEAEAGLWAEDLSVWFMVERDDMIQFEGDATYTVNEESEMEIDEFDSVWVDTDNNGLDDREFSVLGFTVEEESDEEAAVVTINGIELFMQRNIPAGPYDLTMGYAPMGVGEEAYDAEVLLGQPGCGHSDCATVYDVCDYSDVVHEAFINVVTAGRDQDDASFTTKVVVPVGESYIVAGDKQIALDVPAYINADGYTMLPVRAVATALGINNDAVQWNQATKTVIIMYGQRIITMTAGQSVVYVSGTAIPAASAVEIVDGRAFLGLRDLATTLGVATINWDPATKVASLN